MIKSLLTEYGLQWVFNRLLYSAKLKMMRAIPATEKLFEKTVDAKRIDIFSFNNQEIKEFLMGLPGDKQAEIVLIADKAINGVLTGFSSVELDYGNPINWHYNPLTKVETSKNDKWYQIPDFNAKRGDIKVVWEASRFTHFFYFIRAYLITGDEKYYIAFSDQLKKWLNENLYPYGANYKCGQECTLRMINGLIAYSFFRFEGLTTEDDKINIYKLVHVCYKKILSNFFYAHKCIKNNHTLSEICGLIIGAWCCEDKIRLRKAYKLLDKEVQKQFLPDGGYIQYSFNYQRFVLQVMECILKLSKKTGISVSEQTKQCIKNSALLMYQMQDESGDIPNYGSNDGALIFPVTSCGYRDFRPVLNTIYALIEGKRLYVHGDYDEELLWFGNKRLIGLPLANITKEAVAFRESGFYTLRHNDGFIMTVLQNYKTRPAQMDGLHIDLWHKGLNIFCDNGTYSYASEIGKGLALTSAHNTAKLGGIEQMNKRGAFMIFNWTSCMGVKHNSVSFMGTLISKNGYTHRRQINKTQQGYQILDQVAGNQDSCEINFHTPCEVRLTSGGFELYDSGKTVCVVEVAIGVIEIEKAYRSLYYLKKKEINCISVKCKMENQKCMVGFNIKLIN